MRHVGEEKEAASVKQLLCWSWKAEYGLLWDFLPPEFLFLASLEYKDTEMIDPSAS